ncbi:MAG: amino acid permease [Lactobacillales bacterium]|jgi:APA family basic amino acid/polyamine antiporter|nr:amino acid permease [Lactobacillales bacterium]
MSVLRKKKFPSKPVDSGLKRELKTLDLILLGIGAIVGTGIFTITGIAAEKYAGPALTVSFLIAAVAVGLSGLFYAEFASRIPAIGGPYAYMYSVFGELMAWLTGWFMILEFTLAVSSVASGWAGYVSGFLDGLGIHLPMAISGAFHPEKGTYVDLMALLVVIAVTFWVSQEAKKMLRLNNAMVYLKFAIIILFVVVGLFHVNPSNWQPFMPYGFFGVNGKGVVAGAALVFFAYLGFESVSMAVEEVKNPQKDIPRGVIGSIVITTILYVVVTLVLTGVVPFHMLGVKDPVAFAMRSIGQGFVGSIISVAAILTLLTVTISMMYSLSRLIYAVAKDGLLPKSLSKVDETHHTPRNATYLAGVIAMIFAGIVPLNLLAEFVNIVSLMYLIFMALGIIKLRRDSGLPEEGQFKTPLVPLLPILSILISAYLMLQLQEITWIVFGISIAVGLLIYFFYGFRHSALNHEE